MTENNDTIDTPPTDANEGCVGPTSTSAGTSSACEGCPNQSACASGQFRDNNSNSSDNNNNNDETLLKLKQSLGCVSHVILILSGKGGVGKSTLASQISHTLATCRGYAVGLLDVDLCGPSAPRMVGVTPSSQTNSASSSNMVRRSASGAWIPVYASPNLAVLSISFLLSDTPDAAVVWRGPRKNALIQQFLTETDWEGDTGGLDYLIIDTPPGTSDEHISTVQFLQKANAVSGAIVITTPEEVSMADVRKELNFCQKTRVPVLGVVENMSSLQMNVSNLEFLQKDGTVVTERILADLQEKCPEVLDLIASCDVFSTSGTGPEGMAKQYDVPYWGKLPLDPDLLKCCENGTPFVEEHPESLAAKVIDSFVDRIVACLPVETVNMQEDN
jgi:Mrp family chromosome partitioning ATPase